MRVLRQLHLRCLESVGVDERHFVNVNNTVLCQLSGNNRILVTEEAEE